MEHSRLGGGVLVGINLTVLLVLVLVFELSFGNWFVPYLLPNFKKYNRTDTYQQKFYNPPSMVTYTRDKYGLRGVHGPLASVELVTAGSSTTDQPMITDGQTWQDVIHEVTGISVANAGIDGMGTQSQTVFLKAWLHRLPGLHPQFYLYYIGGVDGQMNQTVPVAEQYRRYSWSWSIRKRSAILQAIEAIRVRFTKQATFRAVTPDGAGPMVKVENEVDRPAIAAFVAKFYKPNLRAIIDAHRASAESVIFVSTAVNPALIAFRPDGVYVSKPEAKIAIPLPEINRATQAVCEEYADRCIFIDLAQRLHFEPADFYDIAHNTPQGARKMGLFLAEQLEAIRKSGVDDKRS